MVAWYVYIDSDDQIINNAYLRILPALFFQSKVPKL